MAALAAPFDTSRSEYVALALPENLAEDAELAEHQLPRELPAQSNHEAHGRKASDNLRDIVKSDVRARMTKLNEGSVRRSTRVKYIKKSRGVVNSPPSSAFAYARHHRSMQKAKHTHHNAEHHQPLTIHHKTCHALKLGVFSLAST